MTKRRPAALLATWVLVALIAGCAGQQARTLPAGALVCTAAALDTACSAAIGALSAVRAGPAWSMQGHAAISTGKNAGNARIDWQQRTAQDYSVMLSAPITRQSWQLEVAGGSATITGLEGGPRTGPDAATLLREAAGWDIPVQSMRFWLRGQPATGQTPERYVFDAGSRLVRLDQQGWRIDFENLRADGLPGRITATRAESRVRLVIDQWGDAGSE